MSEKVKKELDPELLEELSQNNSHESRVELLLTAILKELKKVKP